MYTTNGRHFFRGTGRKMSSVRRQLAARIAAALLSLVTVIGLLPYTVLADSAAASDAARGDQRFGSLIDPGKPSGYSDTMMNPYGYGQGQRFLLSEQNELLLYYTFDTDKNPQHRYTAWYDSYEKGKGTSLRDKRDGFGSFGMYDGTQAYAYVEAVGFDPNGTGRRDHVAYVGYENGSTGGEKGYVLWVLNTVSGQQYGPFRVSNGACGWLEKNSADLYAGSNFFNIAAGDFNGDGRDDLVISVVDDNGSYGLSQLRFANGSVQTVSRENRKLLHPVYRSAVSEINFGKDGGKAKDKLSVDLAVGDFNGDGIDDLAVLSYPNYGNALNKNAKLKDVRFGMPYLSVAHGKAGSGCILDEAAAARYLDAGTRTMRLLHGIEMELDHVTMFCSAVTAGDIDNDGRDEIITAGYEGVSLADEGKGVEYMALSPTHLLYGSFFVEGGKLTLIEYQELAMNAWTKEDSGMNDDVGPKFSVAAAAIDGKGSRERIFISGDMYKCQPESNKLYIQPSDTREDLRESPLTLNYFRSADKHVKAGTVGKSYIASVAVGNFEETTDGRCQIAYVVGLQNANRQHKYSFSVHIAGGNEYADGSARNYYCATGDYIFYEQSFGLDKRPNCVAVAIDRDNDGIVASYRGAAYAWSDPQVRAILQASPYFAELNDGVHYEFLNDTPETTYATSVTYTFETSSSKSVSFGAGFAGEMAGGVGPQVELRAGYAMDWCEAFTKTLETSVTNSFSAGFYDTVVIYRTPVFVYSYDIWYRDADGNPKTDILQYSIPKAPRYEQLSIDRYNEFVDYYNGLMQAGAEEKGIPEEDYRKTFMQKLMAEDLFLGHEGDPYGYYMDGVSGGLDPIPEQYGLLLRLSANAGQNQIEYSYSESEGETKEISHGFTFDLTITGGFDIGAVSARAGGYVSLQYMKGNSVTRTHGTGTSFSGTVMGINGKEMQEAGLDPDAWSFNWRLAKWDSNLKDNSENSTGKVPVIGYVLSQVQAPPMPVEDLKLSFTRSSENAGLYFDLSWACGDRADSKRPVTAGYRIYLYDIAEDAYKLVETIWDTQTAAYRYENFFDGREYYSFMVTAFSEASYTAPSLESAPRYITYYISSAESTILKIAKTGTDGLTDTYTIYFADGTTQTFVVENGNGITAINPLGSDEETGTDTYQIVFADGSTTTFTVKNGFDGKQGEKGEKGERGEDGIGIDRVEKLRTEGDTDFYAVYLTDGTFFTFPVANGRNGTNGKDGSNGKDGADGKDGINGKDGAGIKSIRIDKNGDFLFTMEDGSVINAGRAGADGELESRFSEAQAQIGVLKQQVQGQKNSQIIAYCALVLSLISLLWNIASLIVFIMRARREMN